MTILVSCYQTFKRYSLFGYDKGLVRTRISGTGRERSELYNLLYSDLRTKKSRSKQDKKQSQSVGMTEFY